MKYATRLVARAGVLAFVFFTLKGMMWLGFFCAAVCGFAI